MSQQTDKTSTAARPGAESNSNGAFSPGAYWRCWEDMSEHLGKMGISIIRPPEDIVTMGKDAADAFTKSVSILTKGIREVGDQALKLWSESAAANIETVKAMPDAKTSQDWIELQSAYVGRFIDLACAEAARLSGLTVRVSQQAAEPIQAHVSASCGKMLKRA